MRSATRRAMRAPCSDPRTHVLVALLGFGEEHDRAYAQFAGLSQRNPRVKVRVAAGAACCCTCSRRTANAQAADARCRACIAPAQLVSFVGESDALAIADTLARIVLD